jgi:ABC transport system ATP-binding/permease protein
VVEAAAPVAATATASKTSNAAVEKPKDKLTYTERKEMNKLEKEVEKLGAQIKEFEDKLANASSKEGYSILADWTASMNKLIEQRDTKEMRWLELAEKSGEV